MLIWLFVNESILDLRVNIIKAWVTALSKCLLVKIAGKQHCNQRNQTLLKLMRKYVTNIVKNAVQRIPFLSLRYTWEAWFWSYATVYLASANSYFLLFQKSAAGNSPSGTQKGWSYGTRAEKGAETGHEGGHERWGGQQGDWEQNLREKDQTL